MTDKNREPFSSLLLYRFLKWSFIIPALNTYFRGKVYGVEKIPKTGSYIIVSNHASNLDPPLLSVSANRPVSYMAKEELFEVPGLKQLITACGAYPVHKLRKQDRLQEVYVALQDGKLTEVTEELSNSQIQEYLKLVSIDLEQANYEPGYTTEVNLAALDWLATLNQKLQKGYVLTIDYGYDAQRYYHSQRQEGTLQCYYQHRRHNNPYVNLGEQDITTHVNFTALENYGKQLNLEKIDFIKQGLFLMALGLGDRLSELSSGKYNAMEIFQRRDALHQLIDPMGLGGFGVLVQGKNLTNEQKILKGLTIPQM